LIFVLGISTVFAVLILLWAILALMKLFFYRPEQTNAISAQAHAKSEPSKTVINERKMSTPKVVASAPPANEDELIAILNGAVAAYADSTNLRVKSYKKI